jgi:hypothetical protein
VTRTHARLAMIAAVVLAAGLIAAVTMAGSAQATSTTLGYSCQFPFGTAAVSVRVTASLPATVTAGKPIQPTGAGITLTLPPSIASSLAQSKAATVTGTARLDMALTGGASTGDSAWTGLAVPSTTVPGSGDLVLTASGPVPATITSTSGLATFTPGTLALALTPHTSAGTSGGVPVAANCTPATGQDEALGSTTVSAPTGSPTHSAGTRTEASGSDATPFSVCSKMSQGPQDGGTVVGPFPADEYAAGYTDASKMNGSALVGPAYVAGDYWEMAAPVIDGTTYDICTLTKVQPDFDGTRSLPPFTATFAAFGFMPVTATVQLTEVGLPSPPEITNVTYQQADEPPTTEGQPDETPFTSVTTAQFLLKVLSAKVNGTPLHIGAHCQTATPVYTPDSAEDPSPSTDPLLVLSGGNGPSDPRPTIGSPVFGGANTGDVTIPEFTGCGSGGDNLDPLLDASVSGLGNHVDLQTGLLCAPGYDLTFCGANGQADKEPLWTVTGGGHFTSTGPLTLTFVSPSATEATVACTSSTAKGFVPDASGPLRNALGSLTLSLSGCANTTTGAAWTVTEQGTATLSPACGVATCGVTTLQGRIGGMTLIATDGTCRVTLGSPTASLWFKYTDPPAPMFLIFQGLTYTSISSGCLSASELGPTIFTGEEGDLVTGPNPVTPGTLNITSPTP